ncbi:hypothetical protein EMA8858_04140 [Emticicia aquatica]|uniref:SH3b domain-containing protein n=1 Tax=Emticicia aquatica TaxID=1681835 RepID=A0ABM9AVC8_9BACT|nr:SH3 domain-containing protein [Emticicia aquatica]CAH0998005.1 hypothetical protein EMA8858_04140 [Emticicia aquatica]
MKTYTLLIFLIGLTLNTKGQDQLIQKKIDSLQKERDKLIASIYPKQIEKLSQQNDSLEKERLKFVSYIENINTQIGGNLKEIQSLQQGLPLPKFEKQTIIVKGSIPLKTAPDLTSNIIYWIATGDEIIVVDYINNDWAKVISKNYTGYVLGSFFDSYPEINNQIREFKNHNEKVINLSKTQSLNGTTNSPSQANTLSNTNYQSSYNTTTSSYYNSRTIRTGPRGGRYYINSNGNKTYVKRNR